MPTIDDYLKKNEEKLRKLGPSSPLDSLASQETQRPNTERRRRPWLVEVAQEEPPYQTNQEPEINAQNDPKSNRLSNREFGVESNTLSNRESNGLPESNMLPNTLSNMESNTLSNRLSSREKLPHFSPDQVSIFNKLNRDDLNALAILCRLRTSDTQTSPLNYKELAQALQTIPATLRDRIRKLRRLGFVKARYIKLSKGGANIYELDLKAISEVMTIPVFRQESNMLPNTLSNKLVSPSSSINNYFNTTTNTNLGVGSNRLSNMEPNGLMDSENKREWVVEKMTQEVIYESWEGLDPASLVKYVYREGNWIHTLSELQDILDKAVAAVEYSKKTKSPITNTLGFLHSCLARWSVDVPLGYKSREERERESRKEHFSRERDSFLKKHNFLNNLEFEKVIVQVCGKYMKPEHIGWGASLRGLKQEFLNELYVEILGYDAGVLEVLGGTPFKKQLNVAETPTSLNLSQFLKP
jgi:DNA-binding Lrp family transcriptional regulator